MQNKTDISPQLIKIFCRQPLLWVMLLLLPWYHGIAQPETPAQFRSAAGAQRISCKDTACIENLLTKGDSMLRRSDSVAYAIFQDAWQSSAAIKYNRGMVRALGGMAIHYIKQGNYAKGIALSQQAIIYARKGGLLTLEGYMNNNLGVAYEHQGLYATGILHFHKALDLLERPDTDIDNNRKAQIHANLGGLWLRLGEEKQALKELTTARKLTGENLHSANYPYILMNTGIAYAPINLETSLKYFHRSLDIARQQQDLMLEEKSLINIAATYQEMHHTSKGLPYLQQAKAIGKKINTPEALSAADDAMGSAYLEMKEYARAEPYFISSLKISEKIHFHQDIITAHNNLAAVYAATGRYREAYDHQQMAKAMKDTAEKAEKNKTVDLLMQFRTADKDRVIANKQVLLARQKSQLEMKNIWLGIFIAGLLLLSLLFLSLYRTHLHRKKRYLQQLSFIKQEEEIGRLKADSDGEERARARIARELHDGIMVQFSAVKMHLGILKDHHPGLTTSDSYLHAMRQLDNATKELRQIAHNLMPDMLLAEGLGQAISYFCKAMGSMKGLDISYQQYGVVQRFYPEFEISLYRILQELLQNVIKHAMAHRVLVQLNAHPDMLCITVEDDGKGFDTSGIAATEGMGLRSIQNRVKALGGQLDIRSNPGYGTTVYLEFEIFTYIDKKANEEPCEDSYNR